MNSVVFNFIGVSAHAAAAPQLGRSALDAVELMDVGANYLREHIDEKARIHYIITNGGKAPNIVPVRHQFGIMLELQNGQWLKKFMKD